MKTIRDRMLCASLAFFTLLCAAGASGQQLSVKLRNAVGHWQIVNSDGSLGGQVETYLQNGKLFGRVSKVRPGRTPQDLCDKCSGEFKNHLILGMVFLQNFHSEGDDWVGGTALDPDNGKVYNGKIWPRETTAFTCADS